MITELILGGPGTGKTHHLLDIVEDELSHGTSSKRIAFVSFTKKAAREAAQRAQERFQLMDTDFPFFQTIHSLCYRQMGYSRDNVVNWRHLKELGQILGTYISGRIREDEEIDKKGDRMMFIDQLSRTTGKPLEEVWENQDEPIVSMHEQRRFSLTYERYKESKGLIDFTDMLTEYRRHGRYIPVDVAIIDEAQDLTPMQWETVKVAFDKCLRLKIAGDDDQAIYTWSGADVDQFLNISPDHTTILDESRRIPRKIQSAAMDLINQVERRFDKPYRNRDAEGIVEYCMDPSEVDLSQGSWLMLCRNTAFFSVFEDECRRQGVTYIKRGDVSVDNDDVRAIRAYERSRKGESISDEDMPVMLDRLKMDQDAYYRLRNKDLGIWHDAFVGMPIMTREYYLSVLRSGRKLTHPPRVTIDTIHSVKGGEADHVLLSTDLTRRTDDNKHRNIDSEIRVFYVGMTRARESLHILTPRTDRYFQL